MQLLKENGEPFTSHPSTVAQVFESLNASLPLRFTQLIEVTLDGNNLDFAIGCRSREHELIKGFIESSFYMAAGSKNFNLSISPPKWS